MHTDEPGWRVAIIGAGVAGASAGRALADRGAAVTVFDKSRGAGGRCTTRRHEALAFDHGAQYFTARDDRFQRQVARWASDSVVSPWRPTIGELRGRVFEPTPRDDLWVGTPRMNAMVRSMLDGLETRFGQRIVSIRRGADGWRLATEAGEIGDRFDQLLVTVPAPQVPPLVGDAFPAAAARATAAEMSPCWALMVAFAERVALPFDAARVAGGGPIRWLARNGSKPGRPDAGPDCWVVHADHGWSREHLEAPPDGAAAALVDAFARLAASCRSPCPRPDHARAHRWRYALASPVDAPGCLIDPARGVALAGDWLSGGRVEAAWQSGQDAAAALHDARRDQPAGQEGAGTP